MPKKYPYVGDRCERYHVSIFTVFALLWETRSLFKISEVQLLPHSEGDVVPAKVQALQVLLQVHPLEADTRHLHQQVGPKVLLIEFWAQICGRKYTL